MSKDRVHPLKLESTNEGGEVDDFPSSLNKNEDYIDARGFTIQNDISNDEIVYVSRDNSNNMIFYDSVVGVEKTLSDLLAGGEAFNPNNILISRNTGQILTSRNTGNILLSSNS